MGLHQKKLQEPYFDSETKYQKFPGLVEGQAVALKGGEPPPLANIPRGKHHIDPVKVQRMVEPLDGLFMAQVVLPRPGDGAVEAAGQVGGHHGRHAVARLDQRGPVERVLRDGNF